MKQIYHPAAKAAASADAHLPAPQRSIDWRSIEPSWLTDQALLPEPELDQILMLATHRPAVDLMDRRFAQ